MSEYNYKFCEMCGNAIPIHYSSKGRKESYSNYIKHRFCSRKCKNESQRIERRVVNPVNKDRLYHVWQGMKSRCYNKNNISYKWYGGVGIGVCDEWLHNYPAFREWSLSNGYDENKTRKEQSIDRVDNNKDYSPQNCRWVTHSENCKNTSRNVMIEYMGKKQCLMDWSKELGMSYKLIQSRALKTNDPNIIFDKRMMAHRSNTGEKGITWDKKRRIYVVYADGGIYLGTKKEFEDAIKLRKSFE